MWRTSLCQPAARTRGPIAHVRVLIWAGHPLPCCVVTLAAGSVAVLAARAYVALGNYSGAAGAWEKETEAAPSEVKGYECLAINAYSAGQSRKGDLAAAKALTLLPKAQQTTVKSSFTAAKGSKSSAQQLAAQC